MQGITPQDQALLWMRYFGLEPPQNPQMGPSPMPNPESMPGDPRNPWKDFDPGFLRSDMAPPAPQMGPVPTQVRGRSVDPMMVDRGPAIASMRADPAGVVTRTPGEPQYQMAGERPKTMTDDDVRAYLGMPPAGGTTSQSLAEPSRSLAGGQPAEPPEASWLRDVDANTSPSPFGGDEEIRRFYGEAVQDDREKQDNRLYALRSIAEGMGNVGRAFTNYGRTIAGLPEEGPYISEGIREKQAELQQNLTPAESEMMNLPPGTPRREAGPLLEQRRATQENAKLRESIASEERASREAIARMQAMSRAGNRDRIEGFGRSQDLQQALETERKDWFNPNSSMGKAVEGIRSSDRLDALIENGDPTAIRGVLVSLARLGGDTGVLTERDIKGWEGQIGLPGYFREGYKAVTGNYTPGQKEAFQKVGSALRAVAEAVYAEEAARRVESFESLWGSHLKDRGISPGDLPRMFGLRGADEVLGPEKGGEPGGSGARKMIRIPASDTQAIEDARRDGYTVETY